MKRIVVYFLLLLCYTAYSQSIGMVDKLIPSLQYDQDMMDFAEFSLLDGFNHKIKQIRGLMKFYNDKKIYAIEKNFYNSGKIIRKITYFYVADKPIAISQEANGQTTVYYLKDNQVIATKTFLQKYYKPYGGRKNLDISLLPVDARKKKIDSTMLFDQTNILTNFKSASKNLLNYSF